ISRWHRTDHARKVFEIHLMADAGARRNYFETLERSLSPAKEGIALDVALEFDLRVQAKGICSTETVYLHGVINHQFDREERINSLRIAADLVDGFAHRGQVHNRGDAGKILQENTRGHEGNFFFFRVRCPPGQRFNVFSMDEAAVFAAKEIFEKDAQGKGDRG